IVVGVPLGIALTRRPAWRAPVLGLANVFQTIPSLALFGFLIPVLGIGAWTAIAALIVYALLPIIRNTYTGIAGVDPAVRDAGRRRDTRAESPGSAPCAPCKGATRAERALSGRGTVTAVAVALRLLLLLAGCKSHDRIVVGAKNFTESDLLAEIVAQQIERRLHLPVERRLHLGGTFVCHQAITAGQIDLYVEYSGTAFTAVLKHPPVADRDS